jgi:opacity protein-like surface antigen
VTPFLINFFVHQAAAEREEVHRRLIHGALQGGPVMKRFLCVIVIALLLIAGVPPVHAADGTKIEAGIKMWLNNWHRDQPGFVGISSDSTMLLGPAVEAKLGERVFLEASYLFSTADYRFSETGDNISRQDADLAVGYLVVPEFGLFAGYKQATFKWATGVKETLSGPVMGIVLQAPMDPWLTFYGRLLYLFTEFEQDDAGMVNREDSPGWGLEFGLKYTFTRQFLGSIGYRYEENTGNKSDATDSFSGLTFGAMIRF